VNDKNNLGHFHIKCWWWASYKNIKL